MPYDPSSQRPPGRRLLAAWDAGSRRPISGDLHANLDPDPEILEANRGEAINGLPPTRTEEEDQRARRRRRRDDRGAYGAAAPREIQTMQDAGEDTGRRGNRFDRNLGKRNPG